MLRTVFVCGGGGDKLHCPNGANSPYILYVWDDGNGPGISPRSSEWVSITTRSGGLRQRRQGGSSIETDSCFLYSPSSLSAFALCRSLKNENMFQKVSGNQYSDEGCCFEA